MMLPAKIDAVYMRSLLKTSLFRYLFIGTMTFICEYVVFYVLYIFLGWNLLLANSLSFGVGLGMSFMFNRLWAFKKQTFRRKVHHQAMLYVALALSNLVINNFIVDSLHRFGLDPRIGKVLAIGTIAVWNFLLFKFVIFAAKTEAEIDE